MKWNSNGGTVKVEESRWNSEVQQNWWNSHGATLRVEH